MNFSDLLVAVGPKGRSLQQLFGMAHKHYASVVVGDGVAQEFALPVTVLRLDNLRVEMGGVLLRASARGHDYDYKVRGLIPSYPGDSNRVRFTFIPPNGAVITLSAVGG